MPKLSIITINYNNKEGLKRTVESVIQQTDKAFEFIVIDGNSTDGSKDIIEQHAARFTYSVSEPDTGIYNAMNKGIKQASGEYTLFLNSGDWLYSNTTIADLNQFLKDDDVISGDINIFHDNKWHIVNSQDVITIEHFLNISLFHQATFIKRDLFLKSGLYHEEFKIAGDYEFFIRTLLKEDASYKHIPLTISNFLTDGISNNTSYLDLNLKEKEIAWRMNFSKLVIDYFENAKLIANSKELKWGKRFFKFIPFANSIDRITQKIRH